MPRRIFASGACVAARRLVLGVMLGALAGSFSGRAAWAQAGIPYLAEPGDAADRATQRPETPPEASPESDATSGGAKPEGSEPPAAVSPAPPPPSPGRPFSFFLELWERRREALAQHDATAAGRVLAELVSAKTAAGWPDIFVFGDALTHESHEALAAGDARQALDRATAAVALAPHRPAPHVALGGARWVSGAGLGPTIAALWQGLVVSLREPPLLRIRLGNLMAMLAAALLVATAVLSLVVLVRHAGLLFHDMHHLLPSGATRAQAVLFSVALLLVPVFFRLGPLWIVAGWLLLLSPYFERRERAGVLVALLGLCGLSLALPSATAHLAYAGSRAQDIYLAVRDAGAVDAAQRIKARARLNPEELYALGLRARWEGNLAEAREWLERAAAAGGDDELLVVLGNVRFLGGDWQGAVAAYNQALRKNASSVPALFNESRAYYALAQHQEAGAALRRATTIDYDRIERLNEEAKHAGNSFIVELGVPHRLLSPRLEYGRVHTQAVAHVWTLLGGRLPRLAFAGFAAAAALVTLIVGLLRAAFRPAKLCPRCGQAACRRCSPEIPDQTQCGPCYHAFVHKQESDPQQCIKKEIEAHRYRARRTLARQVLSVLLVGSGLMARGAYLTGLVLMAASVTLALTLATVVGALPEPVPVDAGPSWVSAIASGGALLVLYLIGLVRGMRED